MWSIAWIEVGLINQAIGYFDRDTNNRKADENLADRELVEMFEDAKFGPFDIGDHSDREVIILQQIRPQ